MRHTLSEAARLVGKDRSTIHRHINSGQLSKGVDNDGMPYVETSELIRAYGPLRHDEPPVLIHAENLNIDAVMAELKALRDAVSRLENRLEYRPAPQPETVTITGIISRAWCDSLKLIRSL